MCGLCFPKTSEYSNLTLIFVQKFKNNKSISTIFLTDFLCLIWNAMTSRKVLEIESNFLSDRIYCQLHFEAWSIGVSVAGAQLEDQIEKNPFFKSKEKCISNSQKYTVLLLLGIGYHVPLWAKNFHKIFAFESQNDQLIAYYFLCTLLMLMYIILWLIRVFIKNVHY